MTHGTRCAQCHALIILTHARHILGVHCTRFTRSCDAILQAHLSCLRVYMCVYTLGRLHTQASGDLGLFSCMCVCVCVLQASGALASSLNMLLEFGHESAFDYSYPEFTGWVREAGFSRTECLTLIGNFAAAVAYL